MDSNLVCTETAIRWIAVFCIGENKTQVQFKQSTKKCHKPLCH